MKCLCFGVLIIAVLLFCSSKAFAESIIPFDPALKSIESFEFDEYSKSIFPSGQNGSGIRQSGFFDFSGSFGLVGSSIDNVSGRFSIGYRRFDLDGGFEASIGREWVSVYYDDDNEQTYENDSIDSNFLNFRFAYLDFRNNSLLDDRLKFAAAGVEFGFDDVDGDGFQIGGYVLVRVIWRQFFSAEIGASIKYVEIEDIRRLWIGFSLGIGFDIDFS